jgi:hypothetical protein
MDRPDVALFEIASVQCELVTRAQARDHLTDAMIRRRLERGALIAIAPNVLGIAGTPASWRRDVLAAALSSNGVASHRTAARLHGFPRVPRAPVEVTVPANANARLRLGIAHRSNALGAPWLTDVGPIPTTIPERTMIDLAAVIRPPRLEIIRTANHRAGAAVHRTPRTAGITEPRRQVLLGGEELIGLVD